MPTENSPRVHAPQQDVISQSEVEQLLAQVVTGEIAEGEGAASQQAERPEPLSVRRHQFPALSLFTLGELRKLRVRHETFFTSLTARLSLHLRLELSLQMSRLDTAPFQKFIEGLSQPTHLTLVGVEPLDGICLLDIPPRLGLCFVDRELGGPGVCLEESRDLNRTESRVLSQIVEMIVSEWCASWSDLMDLRPMLMGNDSSGRYLHTSPPNHTMLVLGVEARVGELVEQMHFALPHQTLRPLLLKQNAEPGSAEQPPAPKPSPPPKWNPAVGDINIPVSAELPNLELNASALAQLKPGDFLPLSGDLLNQVRICLQGTPRFEATLGTSGAQRAVQITHVIKP
jgi:flagellar motor switch protein FliM